MELSSPETTQGKSISEVVAPVEASGEVIADQVTLRALEDIQESGKVDAFGDASVASDDVVRAGGFGATDDISSFLPVASDFTDFEANLRGAREYEDLNEEINRPGLGWTGQSK